MALDYTLSEDGASLARTHAWDAVRYLVYTHGREALLDLLRSLGRGDSVDAALQTAIGQTLAQFEAAWADSVTRAHAIPAWTETVVAFDPEMAAQHIQALSRPEFGGRQAGSSGAEAAAAYVADRFAEYGLLPAGDVASETSFLQRFPISYIALLLAPRLEIAQKDRTLDAFAYRQDFSVLVGTRGKAIEGELVWVRDEDYRGMDLNGKIVLRKPSQAIHIEIARAAASGAQGLILVGNKDDAKEFFAKDILPADLPPEGTIPTLELTQEGYSRLLAVTGYTQPILVNSPPAMTLGVDARIEILLGLPETVDTANVLGLLPGSDPILSQEVIVLGAHYDHVGDDPDALLCPAGVSGVMSGAESSACERVEGAQYPGANDNASGVGVLLEIARLWHESGYRPQRSVLFAAWGAQEMGELGSRYYALHPSLPLTQTVVMLQLDAVGGGGGHYMEAQGFWEQEGLLLFSFQVAKEETDGRLKLSTPSTRDDLLDDTRALYMSPFDGRAYMLLKSKVSDHATFRRAGIPTCLITWRGSSEDNWPIGIADEVEPYRLGVTGRMVTFVLMSVAR